MRNQACPPRVFPSGWPRAADGSSEDRRPARKNDRSDARVEVTRRDAFAYVTGVLRDGE
jgi:hypothetical protein